ncbi:interferon-induced protein 44-like [Tachysurus ichikawai]
MLNSLKTFKICNEVEQLLFLLYGPIGAGKSSTINTIRNVFEGQIAQVVFMTKADCICPMTKGNLHNVYKSKKIRDKMQKCSYLLGVPVNRIFPVCNYHEETHINEDIDCLMLDALTHVIRCANDYVVRCVSSQLRAE